MAQQSFLSQRVNILTFFISLLGVFTYAEVAVCAPSNTIETSKDMDQAEIDTAPSRVTVARVQSAAQKSVQEEASQNKASGSTPSPQAVLPKSGVRIKKGKNAGYSSSSDQSEMRQSRGSSAIQDDDSLSSGKAGKGKSSAKKEESF